MFRENGTCSTCGKDAYSPYRHISIDGKIIEGCIDKCHDEHLIPTTNSWQWVIDCRKKNKIFCKTECYVRSKAKKEQKDYCKRCNLV